MRHGLPPREVQVLPEPWQSIRARSSATLGAAIRKLFDSSVLRVGEPLPSERELAAGLGLSRNTIRAALSALEREGLVQADSTRVRRVADRGTPSGLANALALVDTGPVSLAKARQQPGWPTYIHVAALGRVHERGYQALSCVASSAADIALTRLREMRPPGVILSDDCSQEGPARQVLGVLRQWGVPTVCCCDVSAWEGVGDCVCTDHREGGRLLARYLLGRGCRRILRLYRWPDEPNWLRQRDAGFEEVLRDSGVEILPVLRTAALPVDPDSPFAERFELIARLLVGYALPMVQRPAGIDAIVSVTDRTAYEVAAMCRLMGLTPNRDVILAGYDNCWAQSAERELEPVGPAVTVDKHYYRIGEAMVDLMLEQLQGKAAQPPRRQRIAPELVEIVR